MGWQFTLAEFVGGLIMIAIMTVLLRAFISRRLEAQAREHAIAADSGHQHHSAAGDGHPRAADEHRAGRRGPQLPQRLVDAVEGDHDRFLLAASSASCPTASSTRSSSPKRPPAAPDRNAIVGPLIAIMSFVCSVGNVPLARAVVGGISFAGVIAFIFADLLVLPIIAIYRKYYGARTRPGWSP